MPDGATRRRASARRPPPIPAAVTATPPPADPAAFLEYVRALTNVRQEIRSLTASEETASGGRSAGDAVRSRQLGRRAQLKAMRTWHDTATARLDDLRRRPMPTGSEQEVKDVQRRLVVSMSKNAARMATLEGAERRWHVAAKMAREGIRLRRDVGAEVMGSALKPDARLHLQLAHATFMVEGNSPRLRCELADAVTQNPRSRALTYWLARYELMAGRHAAALTAVAGATDYPPIRNNVLPLLTPDATAAPWLTWPSNFYTYRYELSDDDELRGMQGALAALSNDTAMVQAWLALGIPQVALDRLRDHAVDTGIALRALLLWNQANADFARRRYVSAGRNYGQCQRTIVEYFAARYPSITLPTIEPADPSNNDIAPAQQLESALDILAARLVNYNGPARYIWSFFRERYMALTLEELHGHDWRRPNVVPLAYEFAAPLPNYGESTDLATALVRLLIRASILKSLQTEGDKVEEKIDAPLLAIALVFCPLGIAEASRLRREFDEGLSQCRQLLRRHSKFKVLSEVIEKPFVKILKAQILLDKADGQYKAGAMAATPATNPDGSLKYQGLEAADTYQGVLVNFEDQGQYVNLVNTATQTMQTELLGLMQRTFHPLAVREPVTANPDPPLHPLERRALGTLGKRIAIPTIVARRGDYPEPDRRVRPHEPLVAFSPPPGASSAALSETNPIVYSLLLQARARLLQMEAGLNYLGYSDDYIPPWRFHYLLDRARYFVEHAKNAQREYLNFLTNAEREEFQEQTAAQNVELEKSNIRLETARVDQVTLEVEVAKASTELAELTAANATTRLDAYEDFDARADDLADQALAGSIVSGIVSVASGFASGGPVGAIGGLLSAGGQVVSERAQLETANEQREFEKISLGLSAAEAAQAAVVAQRQLGVANAGLLVAGMQRAAAVLRHEFALQNLTWLRNRTLNAELWYRLSSSIRAVADTYLRYAIEMAFLAEQAYEFEADKRMDVIRFDYDVSDLGDMLAGDFLLRDLDRLEQDLVVTHRIRQQRVRYVLSLAREFPAALAELREHGAATFSLRLEQIERRFPGLFNVRTASVEVLPLALMDTTRFALELTHLGSGHVRLRSDPMPTTEILATDWLTGLDSQWSVRIRTTGPETAVFSGLSRAEQTEGSFFAAQQRGAFEGTAGAGAWRIDLSAKENRVVPDSLADVLVTFTLTGYFDATLRDAIDRAPRRPQAVTSWLSGHQMFPDAYYRFNQSGRMEWRVTPDLLTVRGTVADLRNIGVLYVPAQQRPELSRLTCSYPVEFELDGSGNVTALRQPPAFTFASNGLDLDVATNLPTGATVTFDFGDGTDPTDSSALPHSYAAPGRYDVTVRIAFQQELTEYRAAVVVSRTQSVVPPVIAEPVLQTAVESGGIRVTPSLQVPSGEALVITWRLDDDQPEAGTSPPSFLLQPGRHVLRFNAVRPLVGRFYSRQRFDPVTPVALDGVHVASNRTFDVDTSAETTTNLNAFGNHVFGAMPLSPADTWTFELPLADNPALLSVNRVDRPQHDLTDLTDAILTVEYTLDDP